MATIVKVGDKDITCQSLTFGYMYDIEQGVVTETVLGAVMDGTGLDETEIRPMRREQVQELWLAVKKETYPELYDEDGNEKVFDDEDELVGDKKKV